MIERTAWFCLIVHLSIITTPVLATITSEPQSSQWQSELLARPSVVYVLQAEETTDSVAERLGLTTTQLRYFNQFRTFNKPFEQLGQGDELDIPAQPPVGIRRQARVTSYTRNRKTIPGLNDLPAVLRAWRIFWKTAMRHKRPAVWSVRKLTVKRMKQSLAG
ncbi:hypothetical protein HV030_13050 [Citrobacter freundii]|nr:hypothetical protein [Citrobacter freundii]QMA47463.1 hypothetical protein HV030_13050 [Citrobacter freundii]